ncbi:unnamed protein product [Alopecurus aequalis]
MSSSDELLLVQELPMDMHSDRGAGERRLAHVLPPLARVPDTPPFRPPPPPSAAAAAEFRVAFRGWLGAPRHWELWVAKLRPIHERLWRELGIFDAVLASTYRFKRDASAVLHLASFWSPGTSTFAFPWGEATLTLEDVAVLGGFPADGSPVPAPLPLQWGPDEAALNGVRLDFNRSACKKAHHAAWLKHFLTDTDMDAVIEHAAFLALWLTRFVLPGHPESTMRQSLFPLAVRMARGDRVALGPAVLASLYQDLREMKTYLVAAGAFGGNGELLSPLSVHAPLYILQLWMWERFPILCDGKANPIKDGEPRAARWHDVSNKVNPTVIREVLNSGKNFMWKPYPSCQQACKHPSGWVRGNDITENEEFISLAHCLRACELVGADCIEQYLPHRVAMQFGLDQDVPGDVHRSNEDWEVAWETYDLEGKNVAIFVPHSEPGVTARYAQWWRQPLPSSDLDVRAGSISVEGKVSKRKVKKTLAAMEAEAEKERKMKKARISSNNNDKKRKLEELYDAKLSDWLAIARNGSSGTSGGPGGSCKRGPSPNSDDGSDKSLLASVGSGEDDIVLLVPREHVSSPAVNLQKDRDMNLDRGYKLLTGSKYKGVNLKGSMARDAYHPVNDPYFKEEAVVSTEISTFNEDSMGEWSNEILKNTNELVRGETPDVPIRPEEFKPPLCMENEECSDYLSDVDCSEDDREEAVIVYKPTIFSSAPEGGNAVMPEEKMVNFLEDKCLHGADTPEEGTTVTQELEKKAKLAVDESCGISNRPEEVTALVMDGREEKGNVAVDNGGTIVSEGVGTAAEGTSHSIEVVPGTEQGVYAGVMNIPQETVALAEEILPVQRADDVDACVAMSCIMEDASVAAGVRGTNDGETSLDFVDEEKREISCIEEIGGGDSNQMSETDIKQEPEAAPQVDIVECGEDITLVVKDNEGKNQNVTQTVEKVVTDGNVAAVLLDFPEEKRADGDKALNRAKKDTEVMHKEVVKVEGAKQVHINTLANGGANNGHKEVAGVEHVDMTEAKMHTEFDSEKPEEAAEVGHADMGDCKRITGRDTDGEPGDIPEVSHIEVEKARERMENNNDDKLAEFPDIAKAEMEEGDNLMKEGADEKPEEAAEVRHADVDFCKRSTGRDTDGESGDVPEVARTEVEKARERIEINNDSYWAEFPDIVQAEMGEGDNLMKEGADEKPEEAAEVRHADVVFCKRSTGRDTDGESGDVPEVARTEVGKARERIENNNADKLAEFTDIAHAEMEEVDNLMKEDADEKPEEAPEVGHADMDFCKRDTDVEPGDVPEVACTEVEKAREGTENNNDDKLAEFPDIVHAEMEEVENLMKEYADEKFEEVFGLENTRMDGIHGPMEEDTGGKLSEVSDVAHAETKDMKDFIEEDADNKFQEILELESIGMNGTHGPMDEDTDGKLKEVPEVNAEVEQASMTERDNDMPDSILQVDLPARGEARCFVEEDIEEDSAEVPQVKLANMKDEAPAEKDSKDNPNADSKDLEKEVDESKEVYQGKQAEGEEHKVSREKDTEENTNDALGVKQAEERQDKTVTAKFMHDYSDEITVAEQVDGQSEMLAKIGAGENPEEITRARGKEFDNDTMESLKNLVDNEILFSSASIQSKEDQKEVFVEDMTEKQCLQDAELINERESLSEGAAMEIQGADAHKTLDMHDEVSTKQIHDCGIICENEETQILEDSHIEESGLNELAVMEVDEVWSTVGTHNQEALDLDKETMAEGQDLGPTIKNNKMTMPGDAIMPSCSEFQTDSPETKTNEVVSTKGIQNQEKSFIKEEQVLEKGLECKTTKGNGRPLVVNNILGGGGVDTTVLTVNVNKANCVEGIQNQEACSTEEARQDKQHTGVGDVRILEDTNTNYSGDAGTEKELCTEKDLAVVEKQDEGTSDENTERTLVETDGPEYGEAKHDGSMTMIHETDSTVQAANMAEDKISFKNKQDLAVVEKQDEGMSDENTERTLVETDAPECSEAEYDGTMKMIHGTGSTVQAANIAEDKISFKNKQDLAVVEKQDEGMSDENTERTLVETDAPGCAEAEHEGTMKMIHETGSTVQAANMAEERISFKSKQDLAVVEKQDEGTSDENTERTLVETDAPECGEVEHDGTMKMIHETGSTVQAANMAEDRISFKIKQDLAVVEKQDGGTSDENTERALVETDVPECGEAEHDGTMKMIHETDSTGQAANMAEDRISFKNKQNPAVPEKQDEGAADENTERTLADTDAHECGEAKHVGTMKMIHGTDSALQAVNMAEGRISFKNKQKVVPLLDHDKSDAEGSGSNQTARKEFKGALQPDFEHEVEVKQEISENKTEMSVRREIEPFEQVQTSKEDSTIASSGMDRGENNNEWAEEPIKSYGKYASDPVNTGCQTSKSGRPSIEEVRRIHIGRSVYLKDIKESLGRIRSEPSNRTHINNAGYSCHGVQEPVKVSKDIRVPLRDTVSVCGRDRTLELVTGPPEETPRWRQEQYALNILEDVQNARIAEKTRMEMEIRILKAQIVSMQKQVMNMDHAGEVISRSKRH